MLKFLEFLANKFGYGEQFKNTTIQLALEYIELMYDEKGKDYIIQTLNPTLTLLELKLVDTDE